MPISIDEVPDPENRHAPAIDPKLAAHDVLVAHDTGGPLGHVPIGAWVIKTSRGVGG